MNNTLDPQYIALLKEIYNNGIESSNRTGIDTKSLFCKQLRCDLSEGFPILTFRSHSFKIAFYETMMFLNGETDTIKWLENNNINIWKGNTSREFLDNRKLNHLPIGDIGYCFTKNTKILTYDGYKNIENVTIDDLLYTHNSNFKKINKLINHNYTGELISINTPYKPFNINSTAEHPFYARMFNKKEVRIPTHHYEITLNKPEWINAKDITKKHLLGLKIEEKEELPCFTYLSHNVEVKYIPKTYDEWFMFGYFLGDGCLIDEKKCSRINLIIADKQKEYLLPILSNVLHLIPYKNKYTSKSQVYKSINKKYTTILKTFKKYSHNKIIPNWVHNAPKEYIMSFLDGYFNADGCYRKNTNNKRFTTTSIDIAYSIQRLYAKLGYICIISFQKRSDTKLWKDKYNERPEKLVNRKDVYSLEVTYNRKQKYKNNTCIADGYLWFGINNITKKYVTNEKVYNFSVKDDETYTIENVTVHNCYGKIWNDFDGVNQLNEIFNTLKNNPTDRRMVLSAWHPARLNEAALPPCHIFAQFYCRDNKLSCMFNMRSLDYWNGTGYDLMCYGLITFLFAKALNMEVGELVMNSTDTHLYTNGLDVYKDTINNYEYFDLPKLNIKKNISTLEDICNLSFDDIELINYKNGGKTTKVDMAI